MTHQCNLRCYLTVSPAISVDSALCNFQTWTCLHFNWSELLSTICIKRRWNITAPGKYQYINRDVVTPWPVIRNSTHFFPVVASQYFGSNIDIILFEFLRRQLELGRILKLATYQGGWDGRFCPRSATPIHSVARGWNTQLSNWEANTLPLSCCRVIFLS